ncbi:Uncharacterised protein [Streptococcus equi subsp. zooepidemicus]|uniref:hypothetical protein n=1 Tax=Streptococcus equi TaxID=1336 RepID=UPI0005BC6287|nr:hypothetical protein [Streptococcus equi]SQG17812.1 Uncharacterised protein [Streptococcus equi subsp. zooepidemicus]KIS12340.1 hypothetical protein AT48_01909 [Streptococcus equi subsp. zooepidemicus SzAM60]VTS35913.1 Uncharacterised protein [Streptococcus equi subsp. zooepidemicus]HEL0641303.1 hypothetical protein [Streptococcus equi subsp. zooepidemicus]HEL1178592.1 hypothetical protein [Streptococcus equi subsp. zooepidemicus]
MITDKNYNKLSEKVYDVDTNKVTIPVRKNTDILNRYVKVLEAEDNPDNGMQFTVSKSNRNVLALNYKLRSFYDSKKESHHFTRNGSNFSNRRYGNV